MSEQRIDEAIAAWLDLNAGGQAPEIDDFVRGYPDVAAELGGLLRTMRELGEASAAIPVVQTIEIDDRTLEIVRPIARGGMGEVHLARDPHDNRQFVVKVLAAAFAGDSERRLRIEREAAIGSALSHPNIVRVVGRGSWNGTPCVVMEHVVGIDLGDLIGRMRQARERGEAIGDLRATVQQALQERDLPFDVRANAAVTGPASDHVRTVARIVASIADALIYTHGSGVVHRDIKPQNILLDADLVPHVLDFGLARSIDDSQLSRAGDQIGTYHYMSPEMVQRGATSVDHRTDVYSLGVTLYELLTLSLPFVGPSSPAVLRSITADPVPRPRRRNRAIPTALEAIVLKALRRNPDRRYPSAESFAADLRRFLAGKPVEARMPSLAERAFERVRRHRVAVALTTAGIAIAALTTDRVLSAHLEATVPVRFAGLHGQYRARQFVGGELQAPVELGSGPAVEARLARGTWLLEARDGEQLVAEIAFEASYEDGDPQTPLATHGPDWQCNPVARTNGTPVGMVPIPAGSYRVGRTSKGLTNALAPQTVAVAGFYIDVCEVSCGEYARFCEATKHAVPAAWRSDPPSNPRLPIQCASWHDACAYAAWVGKRLPTDIEWEVALRGPQGNWCDSFDDHPNMDVNLSVLQQPARLLLWPVDEAHEDVSPFGVKNMLGNVREFVLDEWMPTVNSGPTRTKGITADTRIWRGGCNLDPRHSAITTQRGEFPIGYPAGELGFRCAISAK